jgi:hypothetical protein
VEQLLPLGDEREVGRVRWRGAHVAGRRPKKERTAEQASSPPLDQDRSRGSNEGACGRMCVERKTLTCRPINRQTRAILHAEDAIDASRTVHRAHCRTAEGEGNQLSGELQRPERAACVLCPGRLPAQNAGTWRAAASGCNLKYAGCVCFRRDCGGCSRYRRVGC